MQKKFNPTTGLARKKSKPPKSNRSRYSARTTTMSSRRIWGRRHSRGWKPRTTICNGPWAPTHEVPALNETQVRGFLVSGALHQQGDLWMFAVQRLSEIGGANPKVPPTGSARATRTTRQINGATDQCCTHDTTEMQAVSYHNMCSFSTGPIRFLLWTWSRYV